MYADHQHMKCWSHKKLKNIPEVFLYTSLDCILSIIVSCPCHILTDKIYTITSRGEEACNSCTRACGLFWQNVPMCVDRQHADDGFLTVYIYITGLRACTHTCMATKQGHSHDIALHDSPGIPQTASITAPSSADVMGQRSGMVQKPQDGQVLNGRNHKQEETRAQHK